KTRSNTQVSSRLRRHVARPGHDFSTASAVLILQAPSLLESLLSLLHMHWDREPTPNPSQEGNFRGADECLLPSWEGSGVDRFMERPALLGPGLCTLAILCSFAL